MGTGALRSTGDRFRDRVDRSGGPDACWPWTGTITTQGYGQLVVGRRSVRANRYAWEHWVGPIPEGLQVCHHCDNPPCCNPAHLFLGTAAQNQNDKGRKGRAAKGEANGGGGKLTEADVRAIREKVQTMTRTAVAAEFGVTPTMIGYIVRGEQWAHVT